ncbi:MAG TPA: dihydrodipicolinate synthase family protein [Candidatus Polarisedimenticolia bacterium]|nr:dihydrodipicolinate synthase family protein [Candidatus Polarisedimenticolia bacterium]
MLKGLFPPIPTPYDGDEVSPARLRDNIARWESHPIDGYVVLGSNGEAPLLDDAERAAVIRAARSAVPAGKPLVAGAGRESTRATIRAVKEAFDLGADAVLVGVPGYYRPAMTDDVLIAHYRAVAAASPGPMLLYSVPFFTGLPLGPALFAELLECGKVAGIKDSSGDPASIQALVSAASARGSRASVLVGSARALAEATRLGAVGAVLAVANVAPAVCARIAEAARAQDRGAAEALNAALDPLTDAVTRRHGIGGLKAALDLLGFHGGLPRPPLPAATAEARAEIAGLLAGLERLGLAVAR